MTTLLIQTESVPLTVNLLSLIRMTDEQFYEFCQANRELRIERTASGEVVIMPPAFEKTEKFISTVPNKDQKSSNIPKSSVAIWNYLDLFS